MSIENIGSINQILKNRKADEWTDNLNLELKKSQASSLGIDFEQGPKQDKFSDFLINSVKSVNELQLKANESMEKLVTGKKTNLHETMLVVEQAEIAFKAMNQVRQKVLDAYKEVMRMQV